MTAGGFGGAGGVGVGGINGGGGGALGTVGGFGAGSAGVGGINGVYGFQFESKELGMGNEDIQDSQITSSTAWVGLPPEKGRLNGASS